jgi:hypothetical protein
MSMLMLFPEDYHYGGLSCATSLCGKKWADVETSTHKIAAYYTHRLPSAVIIAAISSISMHPCPMPAVVVGIVY